PGCVRGILLSASRGSSSGARIIGSMKKRSTSSSGSTRNSPLSLVAVSWSSIVMLLGGGELAGASRARALEGEPDEVSTLGIFRSGATFVVAKDVRGVDLVEPVVVVRRVRRACGF